MSLSIRKRRPRSELGNPVRLMCVVRHLIRRQSQPLFRVKRTGSWTRVVEELAGKGVRCQATLEIRAILKRLFFVMPDLVPRPTTQLADGCYLPVGPAPCRVLDADHDSVAPR